MATSQFGVVLAALKATAEAALAAEDVLVTYGSPISDDPGDYLMFGVDDPSSLSPTIGSWEQAVATLGRPRTRDESGTINCAAASHNGEADLQTALEQALVYIAAVEDFLRADPSLGLTVPGRVTIQIGGSGSPYLAQDEFGVYALVVFTVTYEIRI